MATKNANIIELPELRKVSVQIRLIGDSPLIVHRFGEKARKMMLDKQMGVASTGRHDLPMDKRILVGIGIQPLSATAIFMAAELAAIYPEVSSQALLLPLLAAALMEFAGPQLCKYALQRAGETEPPHTKKNG